MTIDVLVIDNQEIARAGFCSLFGDSEMRVVAAVAGGAEAIKMAKKHRPGVVLLDVSLPELNGFETLPKLQAVSPVSRVVMTSAHYNPTYVARAVAWGAVDFILKGASRRQMANVIRAAASGTCPCPQGEMYAIAEIMRNAEISNGLPFSGRQMQVLRHLALGLSNNEICRSLSIGLQTVKEHVLNISRTIPVSDRTQAAVWAIRKGLV